MCGYVHRGPVPPERCPICGAARAEFEPYEEPSVQLAPEAGDSPGAAGQDASAPAIRAVIVGGGIAGVSAAEAVRNASPDSSITLISCESHVPYYRLNLTRYLAGEIDVAALAIHPESWYGENRIELIAGREIVKLSADTRTVEFDDGRTMSYDKLILAMGSHPFVPPMPGTELDGVFTLRTSDDADAILERVEGGAACVCIGGGILGLETAGALAKRGGDVTLLESHAWLMPRQLNSEAAALLESHLSDLGVRFRKPARTQELRGTDGTVTHVVLQDRERIPCGIVIICTGVRPNTYLARKAGLAVNRGVVVDNHLVTSDPDILAAGDVAEHNGIVYGVWGPSQFQGTIAGLNALGIDTSFGGLPRSNTLKVMALDMLSIGQFAPEDGSYRVFQERTDDVFRHFVFHDGRMVGCILLGDTEPAPRVKQAIEGKKDFSGLLGGTPDCSAIMERL